MKIVFWVLVIAIAGVLTATSICAPKLLAENAFLQNFISNQLLSILALIVTVTSASAANIHLAFNRAEETMGKIGHFDAPRKEVNSSVFWLIALFLILVVLLIVRSYFFGNLTALSLFNASALLILLVNVLVLIDITATVFAIHPLLPKDRSNI